MTSSKLRPIDPLVIPCPHSENRNREELSGALAHHSAAALRASLPRLMEQIILVRKEAEKVAGEASISADWHAHVNALKREFCNRPAVKAAFADWDL